MTAVGVQLYIIFESTPAFQTFYEQASEGSLLQLIQRLLPGLRGPVSLSRRPAANWSLSSDGKRAKVPVVIPFSAADYVGSFDISTLQKDPSAPIIGLGVDIGAEAGEHWCPVGPDGVVFGTRKEARRLIGADELTNQSFTGKGVNVVLIDRGLNKDWLTTYCKSTSYGGGWPFVAQPGDTRPDQKPGQTAVADARHGLMLARNILDLAPDAVLWDLPLLPPRILALGSFLSDAQAAFNVMLADIYSKGGSWILVNAWAIYDRRQEIPLGNYTENNRSDLHPFTALIDNAVTNNLDVVFCAGNCGEYCPDGRCGPADQGPGHSIWGANSFYRVLSVGAARTDATWIGYSSQGPGQPNLGPPLSTGVNQKPDLCAPSGFCEDFDAHQLNAGTSAATGVMAGVLAALRSNWPSTTVAPAAMIQKLNATAQPPLPGGWNQRYGNGIVDIPKVLKVLP
jgi:Subtilase family